MKKFISLTLVVILALALCLPVAARYIHCPYCWDGKVLTEELDSEFVGYVECPIDESMRDPVYEVTYREYCNSCDYEMVWTEEESYCRH